MDELTKSRIVQFNNKFGINTEFITDANILGYALGKTIYINCNIEHDYEKTNKHELLHFFEGKEEFEKIKLELFDENRDDLDKIREQYKLRYYGVYSEEEIDEGVLDNEIAIDLMVGNSIIEYDNGLKIGDRLLGNIEHGLKEKRYLNLSVKKNIQNMNLSEWEKIFVANYYDGKKHILPRQDKSNKIRAEIERYLNELYMMSEQEFKIDPHSPEILRAFNSEIKLLRVKGKQTKFLEQNRERILQKLSINYSKMLYAEYKHIVDIIKGEKYEPAFKCLMLRETLTKLYKLDTDNRRTQTIVKKRKLNQSISAHMALNKNILDYIYTHIKNIEEYHNFANLYFSAVEEFKKTITSESRVTLNVETYGKGKWIKFEGKKTNKDKYMENAKKLSALVQDTPWCTKAHASSQLEEGDFYVFVDNEGKPQVAVKMNGEEIDEVSELESGSIQELEEYRDVAIAFLTENIDIKNGREWLEKEEWNKRLIEYKRKINSGRFTIEDMPQFVEDYFRGDYSSSGKENINRIALKEDLKKIKGLIAKYYECTEEEICLGDADFSKSDLETVPYKVIFGNAKFGYSKIKNLGELQCIGGNADFADSEVENLEGLKKIGGDAYFSFSKVKNLGELQRIGGSAYFIFSKIKDLNQLQIIEGNVNFRNSLVENLGKLQRIGGNVDFTDSQMKKLGELQKIGGNVDFRNSLVEDLSELQKIEGNAIFENSLIKSLGKLQSIKGNAYFSFSKVRDLGQLKIIRGDANFSNSQVDSLGQLQNIFRNIEWGERLDLKEQYELRQEEFKKIRLSGQDIGMTGFGMDIMEYDEAEYFLNIQIMSYETRRNIPNE